MTDATWKKKPGSADFNTGSNWSTGTVPDGTASFGASSIHAISLSGSATLAAWKFAAGAPHYSFDFTGVANLIFTGAGIQNGANVSIDDSQVVDFTNHSSAGKAHFTVDNALEFHDTSTAANAAIANNASLTFYESGTAGKAHISNAAAGEVEFNNSSGAGSAHINGAGTVAFRDTSSAGSAVIKPTSGAVIDLFNTSSAGNATIVAGLGVEFQAQNSSDAGHAKLTAGSGGYVDFYDSANGGNAKIVAEKDGNVGFVEDSLAGSATITAEKGGSVSFEDNADGDSARLIADAGGTISFADSDGEGANHIVHAGSIEGAGEFSIGRNELMVGSNNRSTKVSGLITDNGSSPSGSIDKVGTGTLTLSHQDNTFSGGVTIDSGTLSIAAKGAAGTGAIFFEDGTQHVKIANAAFAAHDFSTQLFGFNTTDTIDLSGLKFVAGAKATFDSGVLTVKSGGVTDTLHLFLLADADFKASNDGHGGTKIVISGEAEKSVHDTVHTTAHDVSHDFLL